MDFSGIQKGVHDVWEFVWPPVLLLLLLGGVAYYLAKERIALVKLPLTQLEKLNNPQVYKTLKRLELIKLIPFGVIFFVLFTFYVTNVVVRGLGNVLPGNVTYRSGELLIKTANSDDLARIWAASFPTVADPDKLALAIDQRLVAPDEDELTPAFSNIGHWSDEVGETSTSLDTVKVLIVWATFCFLLGFKRAKRKFRRIGRFLLCMIVLTAIGAYFVAGQVYAIEQLGFAKASAAQVVIVTEAKDMPPSIKIASYRKMISNWANGMTKDEKWWRFEVMNSYYLTWLRRTFFGEVKDAPTIIGHQPYLNQPRLC